MNDDEPLDRVTTAAPFAGHVGKSANSLIARLVIAKNIADVEELWRRAEYEMIASPYQTYAWCSAWLATAGARRREEPLVVVAFDASNRAMAILPLVKRRTFGGLVICEFPGGRHSNANFGLFASTFADHADAQTVRWILRETARLVGGIDLFRFVNMPLAWGARKCWTAAAGGQPSPSSLHATLITGTFEEWQSARLSPSRRKKLRQKLNYLNRFGPVRLLEGSTSVDIDRILNAFHDHKRRRFSQLELDDPFADPDIRNFIRMAASRGSSDRPDSAIMLFALEVDGDIASPLGAAVAGQSCSAMFLSFDNKAAVRAGSPGDLLVALVIEKLCERGFLHFDLGIGEAPYKERYCAQVVPLRDFFFGTTYRGILIANACRAAMAAKRVLKKLGYSRPISVTITRLRRFFAFR